MSIEITEQTYMTTEEFITSEDGQSASNILSEILNSIPNIEISNCPGSCTMVRQIRKSKGFELTTISSCYKLRNLLQIFEKCNQVPALEEDCSMPGQIELSKLANNLVVLIQMDLNNFDRDQIQVITLLRLGKLVENYKYNLIYNILF